MGVKKGAKKKKTEKDLLNGTANKDCKSWLETMGEGQTGGK